MKTWKWIGVLAVVLLFPVFASADEFMDTGVVTLDFYGNSMGILDLDFFHKFIFSLTNEGTLIAIMTDFDGNLNSDIFGAPYVLLDIFNDRTDFYISFDGVNWIFRLSF